MTTKEKVLFFENLKEIVPALNRTTLWRWIRSGKFPRSKKIGPRRVGWLSSEIDAWLVSLSDEGRRP